MSAVSLQDYQAFLEGKRTIFDPFTGIGSTGYITIKNNRCFVGRELNSSSFTIAQKNPKKATTANSLPTLFEIDAQVAEA